MLKAETLLQLQLSRSTRSQYPSVIFRSDYAAGQKLDGYHKKMHSQMQSSRAFPDWQLLEFRHGYHGLLIELKAAGVHLKLTRDGKDRKKGDWVSDHVEEQSVMISRLLQKGYYATFAIGLEEAESYRDWYLGDESLSYDQYMEQLSDDKTEF